MFFYKGLKITRNFADTVGNKINYYSVLELSKNCSQKDIKYNFLRLTKIYHPDVYKGNDKGRYQLIKESYQTLKNPIKRKKYDKEFFNNKKDTVDDNDINNKEPDNSNKFYDFKINSINKDRLEEEIQKLKDKTIVTNFSNISSTKTVVEFNMNEYELNTKKFVNKFNRNIFQRYEDNSKNGNFNENIDEIVDVLNNKNNQTDDDKAIISSKTKKVIKYSAIIVLIVGLYEVYSIKSTNYKKFIEKYEEIVDKQNENSLLEVRSRFEY